MTKPIRQCSFIETIKRLGNSGHCLRLSPEVIWPSSLSVWPFSNRGHSSEHTWQKEALGLFITLLCIRLLTLLMAVYWPDNLNLWWGLTHYNLHSLWDWGNKADKIVTGSSYNLQCFFFPVDYRHIDTAFNLNYDWFCVCTPHSMKIAAPFITNKNKFRWNTIHQSYFNIPLLTVFTWSVDSH